jgi:hypothetical protein
LKASAADAGGSVAELTLRVAETLARLHQARDVQVGTTAKRAVLSVGKTTLYEYLPLTRGSTGRKVAPLLISFALVNRPYVLDPAGPLAGAAAPRGRSERLPDRLGHAG